MYEHHTLNTSATVHTYFSYIIHIHKTHTYITKTKKKIQKQKKIGMTVKKRRKNTYTIVQYNKSFTFFYKKRYDNSYNF